MGYDKDSSAPHSCSDIKLKLSNGLGFFSLPHYINKCS